MLLQQLKRYIMTGGVATLIDFCVYSSLLYFGMDFSYAKALSFLTALSFSYNGHRRWTFQSHGNLQRIIAFIVLYISSFVLNILSNAFMLELLGTDTKIKILAAFVVSTGLTAVLNFIILKFYIFRLLDDKPGQATPSQPS